MIRIFHIFLFLSFFLLGNIVHSQSTLSISVMPISCPESKDGTLSIILRTDNFPAIVKVYKTDRNTLVKSLIYHSNESQMLSKLSAGSYDVKHVSEGVTADSAQIIITTPKELNESIILVNTLPEDDLCNGSLTVIGVGGTPPYTYSWKHNQSENATLNGVCWGSYTCFVNDANNCGPTKTDMPFFKEMKEYFKYESNKPN